MRHSRLEQRTEMPAKLTIFTSNRELKSSMSGAASKKPPRQPMLTHKAINDLSQANPYGGISLLPVTVEESKIVTTSPMRTKGFRRNNSQLLSQLVNSIKSDRQLLKTALGV